MSDWLAEVAEPDLGLRPLPVFLLADCSQSMGGQKIQVLNHALREMIAEMKGLKAPEGELHLGLITFADEAHWLLPLSRAGEATSPTLVADGCTNMGAALELVREKIADRSWQRRSYRPIVVLVSDGQPTDPGAVERALQALKADPKARQAQRLALAIGDDADLELLARFIDNPEQPVMRVQDPKRISDFVRFVTWVSAQALRSQQQVVEVIDV